MLKEINIDQLRITKRRNLERMINSCEVERVKKGEFRIYPVVFEQKPNRYRVIQGMYLCQLVRAAGYHTIICEVVNSEYLEKEKLMTKRKHKKKPDWTRWKLEIEGLRMMTKHYTGSFRDMTNILVKVYSEKKNNRNWWR